MNITEFLEARISEDEAVAWAASESDPSERGYVEEGNAGLSWTDNDGMVDGETGSLWDCEGSATLCTTPEVSAHMSRHDPSRVLAECAAKRAIIGEHELGESSDGVRSSTGCILCNYDRDYGWEETGPCNTLRALAAVYKDHPDYQQEWAA